MVEHPQQYGLGLRYRLVFYLSGMVFAALSYAAGIRAFGLVSAGWGDLDAQRRLLNQLLSACDSHILTLFVWEVVCVGIAVAFYHVLNREVYYRRKAEQKANVDGLTEVFNHRYFQDRLAAEIERAGRYERTVSVIMFDLDDFKAFNDAWGHQEGDKLLRWFAAKCASHVRTIDVLARYGGEEFVVILPETDSEEALAVAERIRQATEQKSGAELGRNRTVTVSAGIASYPRHARSRHALILNADAALYFAKQEGKNRCCIYQEECHKSYRASSDHLRSLLSHDELGAIEALGAVVDAREPHTRGHSRSVMRLCVALGEQMGMSADEISTLRAAALLHDLGKISTPEDVLGKPSALEADERESLEGHPGIGSQIIKRVQQLNSIVPGIKHHHERFDGQGYPNGLAGKNIPLLARMIAIADAFDAMTSSRPYRDSISVDAAVEELRRCAGAQFDPDLVEVFIAAVQERKEAA